MVRGSDATPRLSVYRSLHHIYVQVISDDSGRTLAAVDAGRRIERRVKGKRGVEAAKIVGQAIARACMEKGITEVVFDRNGFLYHGR